MLQSEGLVSEVGGDGEASSSWDASRRVLSANSLAATCELLAVEDEQRVRNGVVLAVGRNSSARVSFIALDSVECVAEDGSL